MSHGVSWPAIGPRPRPRPSTGAPSRSRCSHFPPRSGGSARANPSAGERLQHRGVPVRSSSQQQILFGQPQVGIDAEPLPTVELADAVHVRRSRPEAEDLLSHHIPDVGRDHLPPVDQRDHRPDPVRLPPDERLGPVERVHREVRLRLAGSRFVLLGDDRDAREALAQQLEVDRLGVVVGVGDDIAEIPRWSALARASKRKRLARMAAMARRTVSFMTMPTMCG